MDYKKITVSNDTQTNDLNKLAEPTGNIYETVCIIGKRANQISMELKEDLDMKLQDFISSADSAEEILENQEQIELSKFYEKLPKPTLLAVEEWKEGEIYYRNPSKEKENL